MRPELGTTRPAPESGPTPYGKPVIKPPVWTPEIPLYFYVGGLAGASSGLALLSDLRGEHEVARRAWLVAFAGSLVSPALLISDLGVPSRFLHMLRMFKVTSPMSVGSWILAGYGTVTAPAAAHALTGRLGVAGRLAQVASVALGMPLASYTAALIANTSVPAWHHARHELPFVFTAGAAMSAGAAAVALAPVEQAAPARRLAVGGAVIELGVTQFMEQRLKRIGVSEVYHEGVAGRLTKAATGLTAAGAALLATGGRRSRAVAVASGVLLTGGALAERWAIFKAGSQSALRASDTVEPQRARIASGEAVASERREARTSAPPPAADGHGPGERPVPAGSPAISARPPGAEGRAS